MSKINLKQIVQEEIGKILNEATVDPASNLLNLLSAPEVKKSMDSLADIADDKDFRLIKGLYNKLYEALKKYE